MGKNNQVEFMKHPVIPDFDRFKKCILRQEKPTRVHYFEAYYDKEIKNELMARFNIRPPRTGDSSYGLESEIALHQVLGNDVFFVDEYLCRPKFPLSSREKNSMAESDSKSSDECARGPIASWEDFEKYPWPDISRLDTRPLEWLEKHLPENMKCSSPMDIGWYKLLLGYEA
ncbi:MAG: hypothetical protein WC637_05605, partial [Victivallales bacterium]